MKGIINAPHSVLHGRECEVVMTNIGDNLHLVKVDGYPNSLPYHDKEILIDFESVYWDNYHTGVPVKELSK